MRECAICGKPGEYVAIDVNGVAWFECGAHGPRELGNHERIRLMTLPLAGTVYIARAESYPVKRRNQPDIFDEEAGEQAAIDELLALGLVSETSRSDTEQPTEKVVELRTDWGAIKEASDELAEGLRQANEQAVDDLERTTRTNPSAGEPWLADDTDDGGD